MESKIYSRPRFCTTGKGYKNMPRNNRRYTAISIITIIVIAVITFVIITRAVNPIINDLCIDKAKNIATQISNDEATLIMNQYSYDDLITIVRDSNGNVKMLQTNTKNVNKIISDIPLNIINKFQNYLEINNFERYEEFAAPWIIDRIFLQGVFFKKPCFKVEEEYRIAINQRIGENGASIKAKRKFMERNGIFIPYIDLPFNKDAVEGITISPTLDYENTRNGVLSMTAKKYRNVNKDNIVKSDIPVRY